MAKGQPDFFGQPIQIRYGTISQFYSYAGLTAVGIMVDSTVLFKGIFSSASLLVYQSQSALLNLQYAVYVDGNLICSGVPYIAIRPSVIGTGIAYMSPEYLDTLYYNWTLSYRQQISVETSARIILTGLAGLVPGNNVIATMIGQRII